MGIKTNIAIWTALGVTSAVGIAVPTGLLIQQKKVNEQLKQEQEKKEPTQVYRTITFNANGGQITSGCATQKVVDGSVFKTVNKPSCTRDGYKFVNWDKQDTDVIRNDTIVNAIYEKEPEPEPVITEIFNVSNNICYGFTQGVTEEMILLKYYNGNLIIPKCNAIADNAFNNKLPSFINRITLPIELKTIGSNAFANNLYLEQTSIPQDKTVDDISLIEIGSSAFENTGLKQITLPLSLTKVGASAFNECRDLTYIDCSLKATCADLELASDVFSNISPLGEVCVRVSTSDAWKVKLAQAGLNENSSFPDDWLVNEFTCLDIDEAGVCYGFKQNLPKSLQELADAESKELLIPKNVKHISNVRNGFQNNLKIQKVTFLSSLKSIDDEAFKGCSNLKNICLTNFTYIPQWESKNIFLDTSPTGHVDINNSLRNEWIELFKNISGLNISKDAWTIGYEETVQLKNCVGITALEDTTISLLDGSDVHLEYSLDVGQTWNLYQEEIQIPLGATLYLKGNNPTGWSKDSYRAARFKITTGSVNIGGNVMGLLSNGLTTSKVIPCPYCFLKLFQENTGIKQVDKNFLPAEQLTIGCYEKMFLNCSSLINAVDINGVSAEQECCQEMYKSCTSLVDIGQLKPTTLKYNCYHYMFKACTSLKDAAYIPADKIGQYSCWAMYEGCTDLVNVPTLPASEIDYSGCGFMFKDCTNLKSFKMNATKLDNYACYAMFNNCKSLIRLEVDFTTWSYTYSHKYWLDNIQQAGVFVCHSELPTDTRTADTIPSHWTIEIKQ